MKTHVIPPGFYPNGALVFEIKWEYTVMTTMDDGNVSVWFTTVSTSTSLAEFIRNIETGKYDTLGTSQVSNWKDALSIIPAQEEPFESIKIIDIDKVFLNDATIELLTNQYREFHDQNCGEHIVNVLEAYEEVIANINTALKGYPRSQFSAISADLEKLYRIMDNQQGNYIRLINEKE